MARARGRKASLKEYLSKAFVIQVEKGFITPNDLSEGVKESYDACVDILLQLEREGLVRRVEGLTPIKYLLTNEGRSELTVVLTGGTFDILHVGHLATLNEAKRFGDVLIVVIARDETVRRLKGRKPFNDEKARLYLVSNLKPVDLAILGDEKDHYKVVEYIKPNVIVLGYDQKHNEDEIKERLKRIGLDTKVVRLTLNVPGVKTSNIISEIQQSNYDVEN